MIIYYSSKFEKEYKRLPISVKKLAEKKELEVWFHSVGTHEIYK